MANRIHIGQSDDFPIGETKTIKAGNKTLVVARTRADRVCAVVNRCSHLPLPLAGAKVEGDSIICPWHNSRFDLCSGENQDWVPGVVGIKAPQWSRQFIALGKKPQGLTAFVVVEEEGQVYVEV